MKILLKLFAILAAFGMAPALAQVAPAPAVPAPASASSAAANHAASANRTAAAPTVAAPAPAAPSPDIGQPVDRLGLQTPVTPIGVSGLWFHNTILVPLIT